MIEPYQAKRWNMSTRALTMLVRTFWRHIRTWGVYPHHWEYQVDADYVPIILYYQKYDIGKISYLEWEEGDLVIWAYQIWLRKMDHILVRVRLSDHMENATEGDSKLNGSSRKLSACNLVYTRNPHIRHHRQVMNYDNLTVFLGEAAIHKISSASLKSRTALSARRRVLNQPWNICAITPWKNNVISMVQNDVCPHQGNGGVHHM